MLHGLKHLQEVLTNFPAYRWHGECHCGFQTRVSTEQAAKSQIDAHLITHGVEPHFDKPLTPEVKKEETPVVVTENDTNTVDTPVTNSQIKV